MFHQWHQLRLHHMAGKFANQGNLPKVLPFFQMLALIGKCQLCPMAVQFFGDAPSNRMIVGNPIISPRFPAINCDSTIALIRMLLEG